MIEATTVGLIQETQCQWFEPKRLRALLLTVDGAGSGIDADLLDGQHGAYYLPAASYTAADVLAKLITVDGAGSGLDADLLDGSSSAAFATSGHNHDATYVNTAGDTMTGSLTVAIGGSGGDFALVTPGGTTGFSASNTKRMDFRWDDTSIFILASTTTAAPSTSQGITIKNGGDVGIKNPTPSYTLDVTGTMRVSSNVGFFSVTPAARPAAYTQTYATATRTHSNITAATPSAYAAGANGYSTGAKASEVHAAVVAHQADIANIKQVLNQVIDDLQAFGLLQ